MFSFQEIEFPFGIFLIKNLTGNIFYILDVCETLSIFFYPVRRTKQRSPFPLKLENLFETLL